MRHPVSRLRYRPDPLAQLSVYVELRMRDGGLALLTVASLTESTTHPSPTLREMLVRISDGRAPDRGDQHVPRPDGGGPRQPTSQTTPSLRARLRTMNHIWITQRIINFCDPLRSNEVWMGMAPSVAQAIVHDQAQPGR